MLTKWLGVAVFFTLHSVRESRNRVASPVASIEQMQLALSSPNNNLRHEMSALIALENRFHPIGL